MEGLVQTFGVKEIYKSQVSEMAKTPDELLEDLHQQQLDDCPYRYLWLDAMNRRCREGSRLVNVAAGPQRQSMRMVGGSCRGWMCSAPTIPPGCDPYNQGWENFITTPDGT